MQFIMFSNYKLHCKLHRAMCSRFDTILACDRQTDRQDGRNCYSQYSACNASIAERCKNGL